MNVGNRSSLLDPLCTVGVTGSARGLTVTFHPPACTAPTLPPVPDSSQAVASDAATFDPETDTAHSDGMEHERKARLARWQAIGWKA